MKDRFKTAARGLSSPAIEHFAVVPADNVDFSERPRVLKVLTGGNLALRDKNGTVIIYPVTAGEIIQFSGHVRQGGVISRMA